MEDDVDVWRYAIVSCMPETTNRRMDRLRTLYLCLPVLPASGIKATLATLLLACSETSSYAPRSSRFGSEPPSVEDAVDVWCYAVVSCMPETMTKVELCNPCCLSVVYSFCLFVSRKLCRDVVGRWLVVRWLVVR